MLKDILDTFSKMLDEKGDKLILDSYIPADGTYYIVDLETNEVISCQDIKYDKKLKILDKSGISNYDNICKFDYYSRPIDMNKPIDPKKKIQSNNYLSFIAKKSSIAPDILTEDIIDGYYDILADPYIKYGKNSKNKAIYKSVEEKLGKVDVDFLDKAKKWIKDNIFKLGIDITKKDYVKIFFKASIEDYIRESNRYIVPNIYNSNDFSLLVNSNTYGVPNDNMGMNSKKPFFENKTRKNKVPYLLNNDEVLMQKKLFDYFWNMSSMSKTNVYIDNETIEARSDAKFPEKSFSGIFLRLRKDKNEAAIVACDYITDYSNSLKKTFNFENILDAQINKKSEVRYGKYKKLNEIEQIINEVLFSKWLHNNYFTDQQEISINNGYLKSNLVMARDTLANWFYKGNTSGVRGVLNKASISILKGNISEGFIEKAKVQFNLRWAIENYFEGGFKMADVLGDVRNTLKTKIDSKNNDKIENDNQYYFAVGQLVYYFISKNKGNKRTQSLINPFINAMSNEVIKEKLRVLYKKYNYDIDINNRRFNNLYEMILSYVPETKINQDVIIAGYLDCNLIYQNKQGGLI